MALRLRHRRIAFRNSGLIHFFSSSVSDTNGEDQNTSSSSPSQPRRESSSSFGEVKNRPENVSSQQPQRATSCLEEIRKALSESSPRARVPPPSWNPVSYQEVYKRHVMPKDDDSSKETNERLMKLREVEVKEIESRGFKFTYEELRKRIIRSLNEEANKQTISKMDGNVQTVEAVHYKSWTPHMDAFLLQFLLDQKYKGQELDRNFTNDAYNAAIEAINAQFSMKVNQDDMQNRLETLKRKMTIGVKVLKHGTEFEWNDITKQIEASDQVWENLIKVYSDAKHVRNVAIPNFNVLQKIYEKDGAIGETVESIKKKNRHRNKKAAEVRGSGNSRVEEGDPLVVEKEAFMENFDDTQAESFQQTSIPRLSATYPSSKKGQKKARRSDDRVAEKLDGISKSIAKIASAIDVTEQGKHRAQDILVELKKIDGIEKDFLYVAYDFLVQNSEAAECFWGCPSEERSEWLSWKMSQSS